MNNGNGPIVNQRRIDFTGDYEGFWVEVRLNVPYTTRQDLLSGDAERYVRAMQRVVIDWNFKDDDGQEIKVGEYAEVDAPLQDQMLDRFFDELKKASELPKA